MGIRLRLTGITIFFRARASRARRGGRRRGPVKQVPPPLYSRSPSLPPIQDKFGNRYCSNTYHLSGTASAFFATASPALLLPALPPHKSRF